MKIIFIAGPLTSGWDGADQSFIENRVKEAEKYQIALINVGVGCFCPHTHTFLHHQKGSTAGEDFYYALDREFLLRADAVLAMPNWEISTGARKEIELAQERQLPVFYPKSVQNLKEIIDWNNNV